MTLCKYPCLAISIGFAASLSFQAPVSAENDGEAGAGTTGVIFDNTAASGGLNAQGASPASQLDVAFPFDAGAADDFVLPESPQCLWSVTGVQWTGVYWNGSSPGSLSGVHVIIWPDTPDGPDGRGGLVPDLGKALAVHDIPGSAGETPSVSGITDAYDYFVQLPEAFDAIPGQRYWIQIQAKIPYPPQWGMHVTQTRNGQGPMEYFDLLGLPAWIPITDTGDLAFALTGQPKAIACDDDNACTTDSCDAGVCVHTTITCDDNSVCTNDACDPASGCTHAAISCDDSNACTNDSCDPFTGCAFASIGCDDKNACTTDACDAVSGCFHEAVTCDDGDACSHDACESAIGCVAEPVDCDDGDICTVDSCTDGVCEHSGPPDMDGDGDIDLDDFNSFFECIETDEKQQAPECICADLNGDGSVNLHDYGMMQSSFNGVK